MSVEWECLYCIHIFYMFVYLVSVHEDINSLKDKTVDHPDPEKR